VHDLIPEHQPWNFSVKGRLWHRIFSLKRLLKDKSGILCPSLSVLQKIRTQLPKEVTYEGADLAMSQMMPESLPKPWRKGGFFLMIAPADPRKGLDWLFSASDRFPELHFLIAGWKEEDRRFKELRKKRSKNCVFLNQITEEEKKWLLKHARALLALSSEEGFDLPVLEAVQAQCSVILSDIPVHRELYKDAEWVANTEDLFRVLYLSQLQGSHRLKVPKPRGLYTWDRAGFTFFSPRTPKQKSIEWSPQVLP
jgi:glycosyltransferase involved in cell wall biosynthesis